MGMGHFYKLLCEEIIFLLHKGKNDGLRNEEKFLHFNENGYFDH